MTSSFRSSFLSDLYCCHSEVKLVAKIISISSLQEEELDSRVCSASGQGAGGQWFESRRAELFLRPYRKIDLGYSP